MQQNGDSHRYYIEKIRDTEVFFKEYKKEYITKTILELYHTLHNHLSTKEKEVYFGDTILDGKKIETWKIKILALDPQGIYETTEIENKIDLLITNPTYIPGKTLYDYEQTLGKERIQAICEAITRYIEMSTKVSFTDMYGVTPINVKVHIKGTTAELIVTDISCSIRGFFHYGENIVILDHLFNKAS